MIPLYYQQPFFSLILRRRVLTSEPPTSAFFAFGSATCKVSSGGNRHSFLSAPCTLACIPPYRRSPYTTPLSRLTRYAFKPEKEETLPRRQQRAMFLFQLEFVDGRIFSFRGVETSCFLYFTWSYVVIFFGEQGRRCVSCLVLSRKKKKRISNLSICFLTLYLNYRNIQCSVL